MDRARFKQIIGHLESNSGTNLAHPQLQGGVNKGQYAAGSWGMVPGSIKDIVNQAKNRNMPVDRDVQSLAQIENPNEITSKLNANPELDSKASDLGADLVLRKAGGDDAKAAFLWNQGQNSKNIDLTHPYVQKYLQEKMKLDNNPQLAPSSLDSLDNSSPVDKFGSLKKIFGR